MAGSSKPVGARRTTMDERLTLRVDEAAETLGISRSLTYELIAQGEIPVIKLGKSMRVPVDALKAWVARRLAIDSPGALSPIETPTLERTGRQRH